MKFGVVSKCRAGPGFSKLEHLVPCLTSQVGRLTGHLVDQPSGLLINQSTRNRFAPDRPVADVNLLSEVPFGLSESHFSSPCKGKITHLSGIQGLTSPPHPQPPPQTRPPGQKDQWQIYSKHGTFFSYGDDTSCRARASEQFVGNGHCANGRGLESLGPGFLHVCFCWESAAILKRTSTAELGKSFRDACG